MISSDKKVSIWLRPQYVQTQFVDISSVDKTDTATQFMLAINTLLAPCEEKSKLMCDVCIHNIW